MTEIRQAIPADARAVRDVHLASIEGLGPAAYDEAVVAAWAHDRDPAEYPIASANTRFVVAEASEERNRIVGFGWLDREAGDHLLSNADAEIVAVYVHPTAAREGIGSAILADLERTAREQGIETLGLWASLPALSFYSAHGYQRVTEHVHEFAPGVEGTVVEMRTSL